MNPPAVGAKAVLKPTKAITTSANPVIKIAFNRLKSSSSPSSPTSRKPTEIVIVKTSSAAISTQRLLIVSTTPSRSARQNESLLSSQTLDARPGSHRLHRPARLADELVGRTQGVECVNSVPSCRTSNRPRHKDAARQTVSDWSRPYWRARASGARRLARVPRSAERAVAPQAGYVRRAVLPPHPTSLDRRCRPPRRCRACERTPRAARVGRVPRGGEQSAIGRA